VAHEAAQLLYTEQEKEYKQAKLRASKNLGINVLPSNSEIAAEVDRLAEEREGTPRQDRLVQMRKEALRIMRILGRFHPILVGSVWRGTAHHNSDIDIITYAQNPQLVVAALRKNAYTVVKTEVQTVTKKGKQKQAFHIHIKSPETLQAEVVVRDPEDINRQVRCEIYGDIVTGLTVLQLRRVLKENSQQKFLPRRNQQRIRQA
jgi:predicted nucleotidyltransferase